MRTIIIAAILGVTANMGLINSVLTLTALKLNASNLYVGILSTAVLLSFLSRIFTMPALEKVGKIKLLVFWNRVSSIFILPLILLPWLEDHFTASVCLAILLLTSILRSVTHSLGETGWFPLIHDVVPHGLLGRFFGKLRTSWQVASLVLAVAVGLFLGQASAWWKFQAVFVIALGAYLLRTFVLEKAHETHTPKTVGFGQIFRNHLEVLTHRKLRILTLFISVYILAQGINFPFRVTLLKDLGYTEGFIMIATTATPSLGAILSLNLWGRLTDKFGNRPVFGISLAMVIPATALWFVIGPGQPIRVIALLLATSIASSGNLLAQVRCLMRIVPRESQNLINAMNNVTGLFGALAPLLGGLLLSFIEPLTSSERPLLHYHILFGISALLYFIPAIIRTRLSESQDISARNLLWTYTREFTNQLTTYLPVRHASDDREEKK